MVFKVTISKKNIEKIKSFLMNSETEVEDDEEAIFEIIQVLSKECKKRDIDCVKKGYVSSRERAGSAGWHSPPSPPAGTC